VNNDIHVEFSFKLKCLDEKTNKNSTQIFIEFKHQLFTENVEIVFMTFSATCEDDLQFVIDFSTKLKFITIECHNRVVRQLKLFQKQFQPICQHLQV
jgi:hypothetical protein